MDPNSIARSGPEKLQDDAPPLESAPPVLLQPPLADTAPRLAATRQRSAPDTTADPAADKQQETDIWWGSYAGRTMTPSFVVCGLLTGLIVWSVWFFWPKNENQSYLEPYLGRYTTYGLVAAVWIFQVIRWSYRILAINYRLTTRRIFCQRGFQTAATTFLELAAIATVRIERPALERYLRVARLRIVPVDTSQPPLLLEGVGQPDHIAALIMNQVQQARKSAR